MKISRENCELGFQATAAILLLYRELAHAGKIENDEGVYLQICNVDPFDCANIDIDDDLADEIDEEFIRCGGAVALLCELNDIISENEDDFLQHPLLGKILGTFRAGNVSRIEQISQIVELFNVSEMEFNFARFRQILDAALNRFVGPVFSPQQRRA
ncbi:MAG: hypothetical protein HWE25_09810 [Alphaproteobacteria bacterium]|nr:hypothetical protein [Alphaproteobacteria bacterium]